MNFWKKCPDQIGSALVASLIFTSLAREAKSDGKQLLAEELNANARFVIIFLPWFCYLRKSLQSTAHDHSANKFYFAGSKSKTLSVAHYRRIF